MPLPSLSKSTGARTDGPEKILQFGTGRFMKGFFDFFVDSANKQSLFDGKVVVVQSTGAAQAKLINQQDGLYTLAVQGVEADGSEKCDTIISSAISRAVSATEQWPDILQIATSPDLSIIVSNTTEVGIQFDESDTFSAENAPKTFPGKLAAILITRFRALGEKGIVSIVPCELIENNGTTLAAIIDQLADLWKIESDFKSFCKKCLWCNTLVDRIVTLPPNVEEIQKQLGYKDELLTACEVYRLFAIESTDTQRLNDNLSWLSRADKNVILTKDLNPYRERKLRLLNGSHIALAPTMYLGGLDLVRDVMKNENTARFVERVMKDEIGAVLVKNGMDSNIVTEYSKLTLQRFTNPYLAHKLLDITFQSCSKYKARLAPIIQSYLEYYQPEVPKAICFAMAAWLTFFSNTVKKDDGCFYGKRGEEEYVIKDQQAVQMIALHTNNNQDTKKWVTAVLNAKFLWGDTPLTNYQKFIDTVAGNITQIQQNGIMKALDILLTDI